MGNIRYVEIFGNTYRKSLCLTWEKFDCSLDELKKKLINEFNSEMQKWVNEPNISTEAKKIREKIYEEKHCENIEFYSEFSSPIII